MGYASVASSVQMKNQVKMGSELAVPPASLHKIGLRSQDGIPPSHGTCFLLPSLVSKQCSEHLLC